MTKVDMHDSFVLDGVRRTSDGYLTAFAKVARTGIQQYRGFELGRPDLEVVRVYRPPEEVFHADAMRSFAHRPVTLKHPPKPVNAKNWKQYAGGQTGEDVVRDGDFVRVPMVMMDEALIDAYEKSGIKELSMGYSTDIQWRAGVTDSGEPYDAVQTAIRGNHLALVPVARGGDQLRIGDDAYRDVTDGVTYDRDFSTEKREDLAKSGKAMPDGSYPIETKGDLENAVQAIGRASDPGPVKAHIKRRAKALGAEDLLPSSWQTDAMSVCPECGSKMHDGKCPECGYTTDGEPTMKTIMLDGLSVTVGDDQSASIVQRVVDGITKRLSDAEADLENFKKKKKDDDDKMAADAKTISAKDGEIAVLKQQLKDAEITPAKLDTMVKDRLVVIDAASKILGKEFAYDGKSLTEIKKAAVEVKLGDAAKAMDEAAIGGAFAALCASDSTSSGTRPIVDAFAARKPGFARDERSTAYDEYCKNLESAYKGPQANA